MLTLDSSLKNSMRSLITSCAIALLAGSTVMAQRRDASNRQNAPERQDQSQRQRPIKREDPPPSQNSSRIEITEPVPDTVQGSVKIAFKVINARKRLLRVKVDCGVDAVTSKEIQFSSDGEHEITVNLFKGWNRITLIGFVNDDPVINLANPIELQCFGKWCKDPFALSSEKVAYESKESAEAPVPEVEERVGSNHPQPAPGKEGGGSGKQKPAGGKPEGPAGDEGEGGETETPQAITIDKPKSPFTVNDVASVDSYVTVAKKSGITKLQYQVFNDGRTAFTSDTYAVSPTDEKSYEIRIRTKILKGLNTIRFFDPENQDKHQAFTTVTCEGDNCATNLLVAEYASNTQNTRAVVGFEQAGASSTTSKTKPFLDFFFTSPLVFHRDEEVPRLAAWGQIRLATTPDQIGATSVLPANLVNEVSKSGRNELVQSFDFLAGLELRAWSANGHFLSLMPGVHQRTHFYLAGGGGAISPLSADNSELAQIFKIPAANSPQFEPFVDRYGKPPDPTGTNPAKEFVGLVPLDRDRFLRQWYLGLRLKTMYCDNTECNRFKNHFPGTFDLMFGQNEAVTGGSLKYNVTDPNDKSKIIGQKNSYVLRFDAFYPFPLKEASFLYLFGSAMMKVGGGGVRVQNPLFLDRAAGDVSIGDPKVYIPSVDRQKLLQPNRDYYKIGVGVNLTDLLNRNKN